MTTMSEQSTIYISNWASRKTKGHHGHGRKYSIMALPRHWERGDGTVYALTPNLHHLVGLQSGDIDISKYKELFERKLKILSLRPGELMARLCFYVQEDYPVSDGETLCCSCSKAKAANGECHRVWVAEALHNNGWRVILDGEEYTNA